MRNTSFLLLALQYFSALAIARTSERNHFVFPISKSISPKASTSTIPHVDHRLMKRRKWQLPDWYMETLKEMDSDSIIVAAEELAAAETARGIEAARVLVVANEAKFRTLMIEIGVASFVTVMIVLLVVGVFLAETSSNPQIEQARVDIISSAASPQVMLQERCNTQNFAALKIEGIGQEHMSVTKWNNAMTSFESVYHEAYELATEETAKNISSTPVQNWGAPPLLPQIPYNPRSNHDITKQFVKDQSTWEMNELLRPMYLQYNLVGDYHDSIHARAFELMTIAKSLPFAIDSKAFYFAYSAFYARMGISTQCLRITRETKYTVKQFFAARQHQALRVVKLTAASNTYFAARSALPPTLPLPATHESAF